jgi:hypothetical protein
MVVLKDRTVLGLTVARSVLVQDAQTKGVREDDMTVATIGYCELMDGPLHAMDRLEI